MATTTHDTHTTKSSQTTKTDPRRIARRWIAAVAVGGAAVTSAVLVHPAWGDAGSPPATGRFSLVAHHGSQSSLDLGTDGFSAGDEDLMVSPLTYHSHAAGRMVGTCTTVHVTQNAADQLCQFVLRLHGGQIDASGAVHAGQQGPGTFSVPILGGTGRYAGAGGSLAITATSGGTVPITVTLRR